MVSLYGRTRLEDTARVLVDTAMGRRKADLVIKGGTLVNVNSGETLENFDVAITKDRVAFIGKADHTIGSKTAIIDAKNKYIVPGFLDGHVHVESSMVTLTQFVRAVLPHGTTTFFADPHEIANVLGLRGVRLMLDEAKGLPLKVFMCIPSCVPAAPGFETTGAELTPSDIEEALEWEGVIGLGEMMNYPGVLSGDENVHDKIRAALRVGKVVEGHADSLLDRELVAYAAAGITSCHESTRMIDGVQRLRLGLCTMIREGSAWRDLAEVIKCVTEEKLDSRHISLVTDDRHPETLMSRGHIDDVVRRAIEEGVDPIRAIQMATLNTAEHFGLAQEIGSVAPSRYADVLILDDLSAVGVNIVIADGIVVAKEGRVFINLPFFDYPESTRKTIRLRRAVTTDDFVIKAPMEDGKVRAHVIGVVEAEAVTRHFVEELSVENGRVQSSLENDVAKVAVLERHRYSGNVSVGFVKGFGFKDSAVASSVAHDSHNLLVVGVNDGDMTVAVNKLAEAGGGMIAVKSGEVVAIVELPIAGLMSDKPVEKVSQKVKELREAWVDFGCTITSPFMTMSLLTLPVLPELRITDKGLVDTVNLRFIDLIIRE